MLRAFQREARVAQHKRYAPYREQLLYLICDSLL